MTDTTTTRPRRDNSKVSKRQQKTDVDLALTKLKNIHSEYVQARASLRAELELKYESMLRQIREKEEYAANDAYYVGASLRSIGAAIGTSDWATINARLDAARAIYDIEHVQIPDGPQFTDWQQTSTGRGNVTINWIEWQGTRYHETITTQYQPNTLPGADDPYSHELVFGDSIPTFGAPIGPLETLPLYRQLNTAVSNHLGGKN